MTRFAAQPLYKRRSQMRILIIIARGLCIASVAGERGKRHSVLMRFDCDLSLDVNDPEMKQHGYVYKPDFY